MRWIPFFVHFCIHEFFFPTLCAKYKKCLILNEDAQWYAPHASEVVTVFSRSVSGSCSCGPHQIVTLRPWSHLEIPRDKTHQVDDSLPPPLAFPLWHLRDVLAAHRIMACLLCLSNEYQPTNSISGSNIVIILCRSVSNLGTNSFASKMIGFQ